MGFSARWQLFYIFASVSDVLGRRHSVQEIDWELGHDTAMRVSHDLKSGGRAPIKSERAPAKPIIADVKDADGYKCLALLIVPPVVIVFCCLGSLGGRRGRNSDTSSSEQHVADIFTETVSDSGSRQPRIFVLIAMACFWALVSQLARYAQMENRAVQQTPIGKLMALTNASSWMFLAIPYAFKRCIAADTGGRRDCCAYFQNNATNWEQSMILFVIAALTNCCYLAGLHFLPASLNQAIFSTSPIFTLCFSMVFSKAMFDQQLMQQSNLVWNTACVALAVCGVFLVVSPWDDAVTGPPNSSRLYGVILAILASVGNATYCIRFKIVFGDRLQLDDVCLFLARLGALFFIVGGLLFSVCLQYNIYPVDLALVPWGAVALVAVASISFNLCKNAGLAKSSPLTIDLASQLGVLLTVLVDMINYSTRLDMLRGLGIVASIAGFSVFYWRVRST